MKIITIETKYPVPSCEINKIIYRDGEWYFEYKIINKSDVEIGTAPLYIYGHIQQLTLVKTKKKNHINIKIESIEDIYDLMKKQAEEDNEYREKWISNHKDYYDNVITLTVKNKTQEIEAKHIISILEKDEETTTFIVAY